MTYDAPLFDITPPNPHPDAPICRLCRIRSLKWGPRLQDWTRYCGGGHCTSQERRCVQCEQVFSIEEFRYVKYCSDVCYAMARQGRDRAHPGARIHTCLRCGATSESHKPTPHGWRDGRCSNCWRQRIGNDRMKSLVLHNVPWDMADTWAQADWPCSLCNEPVSIRAGVIDHDHACCPGGRSCGKCVRGYLHSNCNIAIGYLRDDPALLRAAADYLDAYNTKR